MLISLADSFNLGVVGLHANLGYPHVSIDGQTRPLPSTAKAKTDDRSHFEGSWCLSPDGDALPMILSPFFPLSFGLTRQALFLSLAV